MPSHPLAPALHVTEEGGRTAVRFAPGTTLDEANIQGVGDRLTALAGAGDRPHLTIDLGGVTMLTSVALAKFVGLNGKVRAAGGRLVLVNPTPLVRRVFTITRLDTILDIRATAEPRRD